MDITKIIQNTALFRGVSLGVIEELKGCCQERKLSKGSDLFSMGDPATSLFVVVKGWIKLYRVSISGHESIIHVFGPGESFAEAAVFSEEHIYPVCARAVEDSELITIPRSFFIHKIEEDSHFALSMLGAVSARQHHLIQQLEQLTSRSAPQRVGAFLLKFCASSGESEKGPKTVVLPYDKAIVSARLNIKPETFSRALAKLEDVGVKTDNRTVTIEDCQDLADYCDFTYKESPCRKSR
ncbi:MAG: Crp/Fnr family transcriptional regulator [Alphaproteobacteria bacterium]|jgi:CRP-like cAMP-binding protein|nr:Crp/Fnr family transcriptional regulator [Alphaproteobacteria bacterium]MBP9867787.1 Crp/Fnr family transcriptional regulator [Alphaproteobacteria bacterium]